VTNEALRSLPSVDRLLAAPGIRSALDGVDRAAGTELVREAIAGIRSRLLSDGAPLAGRAVEAEVASYVAARLAPSLQSVVNATGVILHTNLGRAPLSDDAIAAAGAVAAGYSNLEFDLASGDRGSRHLHVEALLRLVTGAESGIAVNNNASALFMVLQAFCRDREVVVSRGQAVEIGGGFRIPDVMRQSGARLVEVGTTNRTYLQDYEAAIGDETAALLRVHASNFRITGFTAAARLEELIALARRRSLLAIDDLGSGALVDTTHFGLAPEPMVQASVAAGADLVLFSGDKLLGGPQAGLIVGRAALVEQLRRHPLARVLRMDKVSLAALNATLLHYLRGEASEKIPVLRMMAATPETLAGRAGAIAERIGPPAETRSGRSMVGGGSLPEESLPTTLIALPAAPGAEPQRLAADLRRLPRPIVARVAHDALLLDPRTLAEADDDYVARAVRAILEPA
jgi:L-seryl-tRNA(Ser) seleniumtransferase